MYAQIYLSGNSALSEMLKTNASYVILAQPSTEVFFTSPANILISTDPEDAIAVSAPLSSINELNYYLKLLQDKFNFPSTIKHDLKKNSLLSIDKDVSQYKKSFLNFCFVEHLRMLYLPNFFTYTLTIPYEEGKKLLQTMYYF